jgi:hypothetical protein
MVGSGGLICQRPPFQTAAFLFVDFLNSPQMPSPLEGSQKPDFHDFLDGTFGQEALPYGQHIRVVVGAGQACRFGVPAQGAADSPDTVGHHGLTVTGRPEHDPALEVAAGNRLGSRPDNIGVVDGLLRVRSEIPNFMPETG